MMLSEHFLKEFSGAISGSVIYNDGFNGMISGVLKHPVNTTLYVVGISICVQYKCKIERRGLV